jgi:AraC family transcriptional regulator
MSDSSLGKKTETQSRLRARIFAAVHLLESRYDQPPSAAEMAAVAGLSIFHFHRAFHEIIGESFTQHSKRLRLERAATLLKFSSWHLTDIALACGFQTQASFSRGFKQLYSMTPNGFRKQYHVVPFLRGCFRQHPSTELQTSVYPPTTVRIETWSEMNAISLRFYGSIYELFKPWSELLSWAKQNVSNLEQAHFYGLWFDDWSEITDQLYRYECIIVPDNSDYELPKQFNHRLITAGEVAITQSQGNLLQLENTWRAFAYGWFPLSGYQPRCDYVLDHYSAEFMLSSSLKKATKGLTGLDMGLCIPVQRTPIIL